MTNFIEEGKRAASQTNPVGLSEAEVDIRPLTIGEIVCELDVRVIELIPPEQRCSLLDRAKTALRTLRTELTSVTAERDKARNTALKEAADAVPDTAGYIARIAYNEGYCEGITKYRNAIRALQHTEGQSE